MASRNEVLRLYKALLREGTKMSNYNFRKYVDRKVKDSFREKRNITDPKAIGTSIGTANMYLDVVKRSVHLDNLFKHDQSVIEKGK